MVTAAEAAGVVEDAVARLAVSSCAITAEARPPCTAVAERAVTCG
jgi:hypothetical protein